MTCIIVIENSNIEDVIKVDGEVLKSFGSGIYIEVGEEITIKDLLYGLMLRSGNEPAITKKQLELNYCITFYYIKVVKVAKI
ncbi:MAG: hypothetical protein E7172_02815 [Firmicutes bacterium]|nr:hypothetical protein [Bacillota bacterium]